MEEPKEHWKLELAFAFELTTALVIASIGIKRLLTLL